MTIACKNPKVEIVPHANGRDGAYSVLCRVPGCPWTYATGQFVALVSDARDQATHHRQAHRRAAS